MIIIVVDCGACDVMNWVAVKMIGGGMMMLDVWACKMENNMGDSNLHFVVMKHCICLCTCNCLHT